MTDTPSQERDTAVNDWKERARALSNAAWNAVTNAPDFNGIVAPESTSGIAIELAAHLGKAGEEIDRLRKELQDARAALTDIAVYGCGMLNQPAAMNGPEEAWLRKRISKYERVARAALGEGQ